LQQDLDSILRQSERLKNLVNEVMERARTEDLSLSQVLASDLLESALKAAKLRFGQGSERVDVTSNYSNPLPKLFVDITQMERVFTNLILNALQAMPSGGAMSLAIRPEGDGLLFEISDNGVGISDDKLLKIFEPFFTTKNTGSGLGLWICKSIVEQHGGQISASNLKPRGSCFSVRLPLKPGPKS
jgi:two-component system NtrC family sensor kinase